MHHAGFLVYTGEWADYLWELEYATERLKEQKRFERMLDSLAEDQSIVCQCRIGNNLKKIYVLIEDLDDYRGMRARVRNPSDPITRIRFFPIKLDLLEKLL